MKKEYLLIPKNNKGCNWFTSRENIFKTGYVEAVDESGFKTLVNIEEYIVVR